MAALESVTGTVRTVNATGLQLAERPGVWLNVSQYVQPRPELPRVGERVQLGLDGRSFIRSIAPVDGSAPEASASGPSSMEAPARPGVSLSLRVAALQAAADFLAHRPEAKSTDVEQLAERWEAWLGR